MQGSCPRPAGAEAGSDRRDSGGDAFIRVSQRPRSSRAGGAGRGWNGVSPHSRSWCHLPAVLVSSTGAVQWLEPVGVPVNPGASTGLITCWKSCAEGRAWEESCPRKSKHSQGEQSSEPSPAQPRAELGPVTRSAVSPRVKRGARPGSEQGAGVRRFLGRM